MTSPENSSNDELNLMMSRKGNRKRRWGVNYDSILSIGFTAAGISSLATQEYRWNAANNLSNKNFLVTQIGTDIYFYDVISMAFIATLSVSSFIIASSTAAVVKTEQLSFAAGNGYLFVAGKHIDPFFIAYDGATTFTATKLYVLIRDFVGVNDGLAGNDEPTSLTDLHKYNLENQGWLNSFNDGLGPSVTYWTPFGVQGTHNAPSDTLITTYKSVTNNYPSNNKLWWWSDTFTNLQKIAAGNIRAPKGYFIVEAFNIDRAAVSGLSSLAPAVMIAERPTTVSYFAGRVWLGCQSTVYFSQVLDTNTAWNANFYCQEADPTSQKISDLVATDGGVIPIPDIGTIQKLYPVGSGMLVFGSNGVYFIQGSTGSFSATTVAISKMSPIGMDSPNSVIEVDSQIFWMSYIGIQGMAYRNGIFGPIQGNFDKINLSLDTIQTFYNVNFPPNIRQYVKAVFDPGINTVQWLYRSGVTGVWQYDAALNLDLNLQAFYPWQFTQVSNTTGPFIVGVFTDYQGTQVTAGTFSQPTQIAYVTLVYNGSTYDYAISRVKYLTLADWGSHAYDSYLESGFEILKDAERNKWLPYVFVYFRQTESALSTSDGGVTYVADYPSSCTMTVKWNWSDNVGSGKWSTPKEVYRLKRIQFVDSVAPDILTGFSVVSTKNKVRGYGKSLQFRFENNQIGKDFDVIGWATEYSGNAIP